MKAINKLILVLFLFAISTINAVPQRPGNGIGGGGGGNGGNGTGQRPDGPPLPGGGGGNGGNGTGHPAVSVDMYICVLGIVAIAFIIYYFIRKYKNVKSIKFY